MQGERREGRGAGESWQTNQVEMQCLVVVFLCLCATLFLLLGRALGRQRDNTGADRGKRYNFMYLGYILCIYYYKSTYSGSEGTSMVELTKMEVAFPHL